MRFRDLYAELGRLDVEHPGHNFLEQQREGEARQAEHDKAEEEQKRKMAKFDAQLELNNAFVGFDVYSSITTSVLNKQTGTRTDFAKNLDDKLKQLEEIKATVCNLLTELEEECEIGYQAFKQEYGVEFPYDN